MRNIITRDWCLRMAMQEADQEIGAGLAALDPVMDGAVQIVEPAVDEAHLAFGRLVELMRRRNGLSLESLAEKADVDVSELVAIEEIPTHRPAIRTIYQLALYFSLPREKLLQLAGLTSRRDSGLVEEAVKFAARSESVAKLTPEERIALEQFVAAISRTE